MTLYLIKDSTDFCTGPHQCNEVIEAYKEIIRVKSDNSKAYKGMSRAYLGKQQYDEDAESLKQSVKFSPENRFEHYHLGITYLNLDNQGSRYGKI